MQVIGKYLIILGLVLMLLGAALMLAGKVPLLGRLPGDVLIKKENFTFYFPLATCLLVSVILSLILYAFFRK